MKSVENFVEQTPICKHIRNIGIVRFLSLLESPVGRLPDADEVVILVRLGAGDGELPKLLVVRLQQLDDGSHVDFLGVEDFASNFVSDSKQMAKYCS